MDPRVSVIIPTCNYARFLPQAVESALHQTHGSVEVLVVDDGSSDDTADLIREFGERVRYHYQENQGLSAARNAGIERARGEYFVFLDADDVLLPEMVEISLAALQALPPDYAFVASRFEIMDELGKPIATRPAYTRDQDFTTLDLLVASRFGCTVLIKREVFHKCGLFDISLRASEDREMWLRISLQYKIHFLSRPLYRVRRHSGNMTSQVYRQIESIGQVLQKAGRGRYLRGVRRIFWLKIYSYLHFESSLMLYANSRTRGYWCLLRSALLWPCFLDRKHLGQPSLFRWRALARFVLGRH